MKLVERTISLICDLKKQIKRAWQDAAAQSNILVRNFDLPKSNCLT